jgi:pimeloyl-ACP methyl ester carboxylesterase
VYRRAVVVIVFQSVLALWAVVVCAAAPVADTDPLPIAQRHLRKAREYLAASCQMLEKGDRHALDGYYVACEEAWNAVWVCPGDPEILPEAAELYADAMAGLLESARQQGRLTPRGLWIGPHTKPILVPLVPKALPFPAEEIAGIEPQAQLEDKRLSRRHVRDGFGLPVVVRVKPQQGRLEPFNRQRQSVAATAVLRFRMPGDENFLREFAGPTSRDHAPAVLDLANPIEVAAVHIGQARPHLAGDLTAPLLDMLADMPQAGVEGFLQPFGRGDTQPKLEFLHPHVPGKIPVVFIHGLASDEGTWFDLINELRTWPVFHERFEPWVFQYPTGAGFMTQASTLRRELRRAVQAVDPEGRDPAVRNVVLVGHSMGGLHAKLQVVASGTALWNSIACVPFEAMRLPPQLREQFQANWFFEPLPFVTRVVCVATPHRGSAWASRGAGRLASLTVRPAPQLKAIHDTVVRLNPGALRPDYEQRLPTTVDLLEPDSSLLNAIERLRPPCWVTTHSVVGDVHASVTGERDDWVVPVSSARTPGAVSEIEVPACHTKVHHHPLTVAELKRILTQHLQETGLAHK